MSEWYCRDEDVTDEERVEADSAHEAAELYVARGEYIYAETAYVSVSVRAADGEDVEWHTVRVDPPVPMCRAAQHAWVRPHEIVGGLAQNPGCWADGDRGMSVREVCAHCGWYRECEVTADPARPETIAYAEPDAASRKWIARRRRIAGGA